MRPRNYFLVGQPFILAATIILSVVSAPPLPAGVTIDRIDLVDVRSFLALGLALEMLWCGPLLLRLIDRAPPGSWRYIGAGTFLLLAGLVPFSIATNGLAGCGTPDLEVLLPLPDHLQPSAQGFYAPDEGDARIRWIRVPLNESNRDNTIDHIVDHYRRQGWELLEGETHWTASSRYWVLQIDTGIPDSLTVALAHHPDAVLCL